MEYGHVSEYVTAMVQQHAAAAMEETCNEQASLQYEHSDDQVGVCVGVSEHALQAKASARVDVPEAPPTAKQQGVEPR